MSKAVEGVLVVSRMRRGIFIEETYSVTITMTNLPSNLFGFMFLNDKGDWEGMIIPTDSIVEIKLYPVTEE